MDVVSADLQHVSMLGDVSLCGRMVVALPAQDACAGHETQQHITYRTSSSMSPLLSLVYCLSSSPLFSRLSSLIFLSSSLPLFSLLSSLFFLFFLFALNVLFVTSLFVISYISYSNTDNTPSMLRAVARVSTPLLLSSSPLLCTPSTLASLSLVLNHSTLSSFPSLVLKHITLLRGYATQKELAQVPNNSSTAGMQLPFSSLLILSMLYCFSYYLIYLSI